MEYKPVSISSNTHLILKNVAKEHNLSMSEFLRRFIGYSLVNSVSQNENMLITGGLVMVGFDMLEQNGILATNPYNKLEIRKQVLDQIDKLTKSEFKL